MEEEQIEKMSLEEQKDLAERLINNLIWSARNDKARRDLKRLKLDLEEIEVSAYDY